MDRGTRNEPIPVDVNAVERELMKQGERIGDAARELVEILEKKGVADLSVTTQLNWIHTLARHRELIILELGRRGWKGSISATDDASR